MTDTTTAKTRTQLLEDLRVARMALSQAEHQIQQQTHEPQPEANRDLAHEGAASEVARYQRECDAIRAAIDAL